MARLLRARRGSGLGRGGVAVGRGRRPGRVLGGRVDVQTIHNAIDLERFAPGPGDGGRLDAASGLPTAPAGTVRVGLVATFARWKGHEVFLDAAARIGADLPCRFYVVGGPIYRSAGRNIRPRSCGAGPRSWVWAGGSGSRDTRPTRPRRSGPWTWSSTPAPGPSRSAG